MTTDYRDGMIDPIPGRLSSPPGTPLTGLAWADVRTRIAEAEDFLLATADPAGPPHVVPILAVWQDATVCFVTTRQARKARLLARNGRCAVTVPGAEVDLVINGAAQLVGDGPRLQRIADLFPIKYPWWHPAVSNDELYDPADVARSDPRHVYAIEPAQVFAFGKADGFSATRWDFAG
ncbi:pyridoxamine 5'-phosphate oxidase family protein [Microlunatus speluncae]|uniref:pyridoxamine 5'-phosphate oxidase family protein n=1 Tax=Microlunatus speluncae TaxID=2594267 RepID=UPI00126621DE|nr:pyridoxamine 5'-phosphate oxidase family protein [Microlunatus speluncae]